MATGTGQQHAIETTETGMILITPLPGKIMRRLLRDVAEQRPLGDTTTLADPAIVSEIEARAGEEKAQEAES